MSAGWCPGPGGSRGGWWAARVDGALWRRGPVVSGSWVSCRCGGGLACWGAAACCSWPVRAALWGGGVGWWVVGWHAVGVWGSAPWCLLPCPAGLLSRVVGTGLVGGLVVNCIVDASIFDLCGVPARGRARLCFVCFYERSVDALASGADEGRGGLRYSSGSRLAGCDPRVSEWGDPARVMSCHLHLNCIGCGG